MVKINGTTIIMTRGDTLVLQIEATQDGEPYVPEEGDSMRFAMKTSRMNAQRTDYQDQVPIVIKDIPMDTMVLRLESSDTKQLDFGEYVYDIQLTYADGTVDTFIAEARLKLSPEVD